MTSPGPVENRTIPALQFGARLPRVARDTTGSARVWNTWCDAVDSLGEVFTVRRVGTAEEYEAPLTGTSPGVDYLIPWTTLESPALGDMWNLVMSPQVVIVEPGTYSMELAVRFAAVGPVVPGQTQRFGNATGRRFARILKNGTSPFSNVIAQNDAPGQTTGNGTTVKVKAVSVCKPGDVIWCGFRTSHTGTGITALNNDFGGTVLSVRRIGLGVS